MGYFSNLSIDIQQEINDGLLSFESIARKYGVTVEDVNEIYEEMMSQDMDCDDSDDGYALASAGFGTDEDYGYTGDE